MALPSRRDLDELLGSWSNRTSLLQFVLKDVWAIPLVRDLLAPLVVGASVATGGLSQATSEYAFAFVLGSVAYLVVWARLNLKAVFASVLRQAEEHDIAEENKNERILRRKQNLCRFIKEDYLPARMKLFEVAQETMNLAYPNTAANQRDRIGFKVRT